MGRNKMTETYFTKKMTEDNPKAARIAWMLIAVCVIGGIISSLIQAIF